MDRFTIVIFGATGDLSRRKLGPALFNLFRKEQLPKQITVIGASTSKLDDKIFHQQLEEGVRARAKNSLDKAAWHRFIEHVHYRPTDVTDPHEFAKLEEFIRRHEGSPADRLYHIALPPRFFLPVVEGLGSANMVQEDRNRRRVIIEKPFGTNAESAKSLNESILRILAEHQIFRIDHYLGKEAVQNLMVLRFANAIFEPLWNRHYIDHVQITVAESGGIGQRARYYDQAGALRDMVQSHLLQVLTLVAMEPVAHYEAESLRNEKVKVLQALRPIRPSDVAKQTVRAQYRGYLQEEGVPATSQTATYAALRVFIDNWRWQGVPFFFRTGKGLQARVSEVDIVFRCPPHQVFDFATTSCQLNANTLSICLQPDEGFHLQFETKIPGPGMRTQSNDMKFHFRSTVDTSTIPDAYERLLLDAVQGDASLFTRSDEIVKSWEWVDEIQKGWDEQPSPPLSLYEKGSWGPTEANTLLQGHAAAWKIKCTCEG